MYVIICICDYSVQIYEKMQKTTNIYIYLKIKDVNY